MTRFSEAKDLVVTHLADIVPELFGGGKKQTRRRDRDHSFQVANRWRANADLSEMKVWPGGAWKDFVSGDAGDAIDLVAYGLTGVVTKDSRLKAVAWVEDRYGIKTMAPAEREALRREGAAKRRALDAEAEAAAQAGRDRARKAFYGSLQDVLDTPIDVYLRDIRGVDLRAVPNLNWRSFRYRPDADYWPAREFGVDLAGRSFPALLSAMVDGQGRLGAVHYTFLEPDGSGKLDTLSRGWFDEKPDGRRKGKSSKLMFPDTAGLVIRISQGPSGLPAEEAAANGVVGWFGHTEGIEDGLSAALADPELRMDAAGSLSGYLHIPDHAAAEGHLLFRDNDWDKPQAVALFDQALARMRGFGKPVEAVAMPAAWGKDTNDVLNWKGPGHG